MHRRSPRARVGKPSASAHNGPDKKSAIKPGGLHDGGVRERHDPEPVPVFDERFIAAARYHEARAVLRVADRVWGWTSEPVRPAPAVEPALGGSRAGLVLALLAALLFVLRPPGATGPADRAAAPPPDVVVTAVEAPAVATVPAGRRLLPAPTRPALGGSYAFLSGPASAPVSWDPCRSVRYVLNATGRPAGGAVLLRDEMAELSRRTGLRFVLVGATDELPSASRAAVQPGRYGGGWAPVLVAWAGAPTGTQLSATAGHFVTGQVVLDPVAGPDALRHQLGHLAGLDHVLDRGELMSGHRVGPALGWAAGDLAGLARVGGGRCS
jgi:hypothetical protein